jgi:hypothetical protein
MKLLCWLKNKQPDRNFNKGNKLDFYYFWESNLIYHDL